MNSMDSFLELWLVLVTIAFLFETIVLIGKYLEKVLFFSKLKFYSIIFCVSSIMIIALLILSGSIFQFFENNVFNLTIIYLIWVCLLAPYLHFLNLTIKRHEESKLLEEPLEKKKDEKSSSYKTFNPLTEEDRIVIGHLIDTFNHLFSDIDALDTKIAQIIALNGLIVSFVFMKTEVPHLTNVFLLGIIIIITSMTIGIWSFLPKPFYVGPNFSFYYKYDNMSEGEGIKKLKNKLIELYPENNRTHEEKAKFFRYMLILLLIGLIVLIFSYFW
jgi:hypothetical protein